MTNFHRGQVNFSRSIVTSTRGANSTRLVHACHNIERAFAAISRIYRHFFGRILELERQEAKELKDTNLTPSQSGYYGDHDGVDDAEPQRLLQAWLKRVKCVIEIFT